jgi:hypothetical protein
VCVRGKTSLLQPTQMLRLNLQLSSVYTPLPSSPPLLTSLAHLPRSLLPHLPSSPPYPTISSPPIKLILEHLHLDVRLTSLEGPLPGLPLDRSLNTSHKTRKMEGSMSSMCEKRKEGLAQRGSQLGLVLPSHARPLVCPCISHLTPNTCLSLIPHSFILSLRSPLTCCSRSFCLSSISIRLVSPKI